MILVAHTLFWLFRKAIAILNALCPLLIFGLPKESPCLVRVPMRKSQIASVSLPRRFSWSANTSHSTLETIQVGRD